MNISYFKAWILFFLVATVGGFLVGAVFGGIFGAIMGNAGASIETIVLVSQILGFVVSLPISFLVYRWSVKQFIVAPLLSQQAPAEAGEASTLEDGSQA